jgi:hypothetical protein
MATEHTLKMRWRESPHPERVLWELLTLLMLLYWILYAFYADNWLKESLRFGYPQGILGRPVLYPLILEAIHQLFGSYKALQPIQFFLFFSAFGYLLTQVYRWTKNFWVSFLFFILIGCNFELISYCFLALTESLIMTLLMLVLGLLLQWSRTQKSLCLWSLSFCVGLAITLKSSSYAWIVCPLMLIGWFFYQKTTDKLTKICGLVLPIIFCLLMSSGINYIKNGYFSNESYFGEMLLGKAGLAVDAEKTIELSKPIQDLMEKTNTLHDKYLISFLYYDYIRLWPYVQMDYLHGTQRRMNIAKEIIQQRPLAYLNQIMLNYLAMWLAWDLLTESDYREFNAFIQENGPLPHYKTLGNWNMLELDSRSHIRPRWNAYVYCYRIILGCVGLLSIFFPMRLIYRWIKKQNISNALWIMSIASLMIQGVFLVTVMVNNSSFRYSLYMWPVTAFIFSFSFLLRKRV